MLVCMCVCACTCTRTYIYTHTRMNACQYAWSAVTRPLRARKLSPKPTQPMNFLRNFTRLRLCLENSPVVPRCSLDHET